MTRSDGRFLSNTKNSLRLASPLQKSIVEGPAGQARPISQRDRLSGITSGVGAGLSASGANAGARAEAAIASVVERAKNTTTKQRLMAAGCLLGVVLVTAISASVGGGSSSGGANNNGGGDNGGGDNGGGDGGGGGGDGGEAIDIERLSKLFSSNYGYGNSTGGNNTSNGTDYAGYLERCNPGYGYGCLDAPDCGDGLVCVTDNHFSSWCMTCDTDTDDYTLQCALANPHAITSLNIACSHTNAEGCAIGDYAGREERCNPGDETSKFSNFRQCVPGLQCVVTDDEEYTQCVVCQDPFWSEDCVWWRPNFREAAKELCGNTECKHKEKAGRDERCSPTPEHETFGQYPQCATGLRCATTKHYSQCVSCEAKDYLVDCNYWYGDFKIAAKAMCEGAPECGSEPTAPADPADRCRRFPEDMQFYNYPLCADSGDSENPIVCVSTGCYSQCVRCGNWAIDCPYWAPVFLQAAEEACGFQGRGCNPNEFCTDGTTPDEQGNCALVGNGDICALDSESTHAPTMLRTSSPSFAVDAKDSKCREELKCVSTGEYAQCVDCSEQFLYDCAYWDETFLEEAELRCDRECVPLTNPSGPCTSDEECGPDDEGWACVTTCEYSQCVQCYGDQFSWDCGYWEGSFLEAAELRCGRNCEPEVCPHDRTSEPTMLAPSVAPTSSPTAQPTRQRGDNDNKVCYDRTFDQTCEGPAALINSDNDGIEARFLVDTEDECEVFCLSHGNCAAFTHIQAGLPGSGGSYIVNGVLTREIGPGACYFISSISNVLAQVGHRCYAKTYGNAECTTKSPTTAHPTSAPSAKVCYERSFGEYCHGATAFINNQNTGFQRSFLIATEDECETFCLANSECAGFTYYMPGFPLSGGFTTGAHGRQTNLIGSGACYFQSEVTGATEAQGARCYTQIPVYGDDSCTTRAPTTLSPSQVPSKWPTQAPSKWPTKTPTMSPSEWPTKAPTGDQPTKYPTKAPTQHLCFEWSFDTLCHGDRALINDANQGELAVFLIDSEDECEAFCMANTECGGFTYIEAGFPGSGGFAVGAANGASGPGACYFVTEVEDASSKNGHRCYAKVQSNGADCATKPPTSTPTALPSISPTVEQPSQSPSVPPTTSPTKIPTKLPSTSPTTLSPTKTPTKSPTTKAPTTKTPTKLPTNTPTKNPTKTPSKAPSETPTVKPTNYPTLRPTTRPTSSELPPAISQDD
jgi:hypothetical protein